jgi:Aldehyde dehydrogenase family
MSEHGAGAAGSGGSGAGSTAAGTAGGAGGRGAKEILASVREGFLIGGEWTTAGGSGRLPFVNPSTERVEAWFPEAGAEAVSAAVTAAVAGWEAWRRVSAAERAAKLRRISEAIAAAAGRFAEIESLNTGKPLAEAAGDAEEAVRAFAYCAAVAEKQAARLDGKEEVVELPDGSFGGSMRWESIGVVAGICPVRERGVEDFTGRKGFCVAHCFTGIFLTSSRGGRDLWLAASRGFSSPLHGEEGICGSLLHEGFSSPLVPHCELFTLNYVCSGTIL